ncbi:hypothetical protein EDD17DRAFT_1631577, partial [Pisolithus thermaeus]
KKNLACILVLPTVLVGRSSWKTRRSWTVEGSVVANTCYISLATLLSTGSSLPSDINIASVYTLIVAVTKSSRTLVAVLAHYCFA